MLTTSFLSMWLSNTASTAMMLPIANAILKSLFGEKDTSKAMNRENEENQGNWDRAVVQASWALPCCSQISPFYRLHWHKYHVPELPAQSQDWSHFTAHFIPMEYWQKTPFYPAPSSCHAGGNAYEWPGNPKSGDAQASCSINLLLAQGKAQLCGTVVVGAVGMHCCGDSWSQGGL